MHGDTTDNLPSLAMARDCALASSEMVVPLCWAVFHRGLVRFPGLAEIPGLTAAIKLPPPKFAEWLTKLSPAHPVTNAALLFLRICESLHPRLVETPE